MSQPNPSGIPPHAPQHDPRWGPAPRRSQWSIADRAITIGLICVTPIVCVGTSFWGAFSVMGTAACGTDCGAAVDAAIPMMIFAPWVLWLVFSVWAIVRLVRKKTALWVMLAGLGVAIVVYVAANIMMFTALG